MGRVHAPRVDLLLSIGEFSERCGLSAKVLRTYASAGVLTPAAVDSASGYRFYSPGQVHQAKVIAALRQAGVPVADIRWFLEHPSTEWLDSWRRELVSELEARQRSLAEARALLALDPAEHAARQLQRRDPGGANVTKLAASAMTDIGRVRLMNEDAVLADKDLVAVADGMGGHPGGEVAARTAIDALRHAFVGGTVERLREAVITANRAVWERAGTDGGLEGMGTTLCVAAVVEADGETGVGVAHVGDSRAYLLRDGQLRQLTDDHSVVSDLIRAGEITEQDALHHPHRHVLTRVLGMGPDLEPDSTVLSVHPGDRVLLCTDGLVNELDDHQIIAVLLSVPQASSAAEQLLAQAVAAGGRDNVSVAVIDVISTSD